LCCLDIETWDVFMSSRRIFRPRRNQHYVGRAIAFLLTLCVLAGLAAEQWGANLLGAPPQIQHWRALPTEVRVVDGETLVLGDKVVRLYGVAAPVSRPVCGILADRGRMAANELASLVRDRAVECRIEGRDRFGRAMGSCQAGKVLINAALVAAGWATIGEPAVPSLITIEAEARERARGLWSEPSC
jgi:endonuclease YncB( thermonuclease family)